MKIRVPPVVVLPALFLILVVPPAGCISQAPPSTSTPSAKPVPADLAGMLNITSTPPGAAVYIDTDATPSGTTPAVFTLSPITHPIMLKRPGYRDYVTSVIIPPGSRVSFSAQLEPALDSPDPQQEVSIVKDTGTPQIIERPPVQAAVTLPAGPQVTIVNTTANISRPTAASP
jgi:hypothetical protein